MQNFKRVDSDEVAHHEPSHLDQHCLQIQISVNAKSGIKPSYSVMKVKSDVLE